MEYISSDSNIWIDFNCIGKLDLPFKLPYRYLMWEETIDTELVFPIEFKNEILGYGLEEVKLNEDEYNFATELNIKHKCLTFHDCVALAISKQRSIVLLTGDGTLRKIAKRYDIKVKGTIGILDELIDGNYISVDVYRECLNYLKLEIDRGTRRLPLLEINKRLYN